MMAADSLIVLSILFLTLMFSVVRVEVWHIYAAMMFRAAGGALQFHEIFDTWNIGMYDINNVWSNLDMMEESFTIVRIIFIPLERQPVRF